MEDRQCKQMERFSVMTKGSDYFLLLDDKSKQRYNIQGYDPYQIKKKNFQAILVISTSSVTQPIIGTISFYFH